MNIIVVKKERRGDGDGEQSSEEVEPAWLSGNDTKIKFNTKHDDHGRSNINKMNNHENQ